MDRLERYYSLNQYLRETFGCKVYKLALNGGMTCPNRDGKLGTKGCIFCSAGGSGEFAERISEGNAAPCGEEHQLFPGDRSESAISAGIAAQIERAKERVKNKISDGKYIAYFQAYTNTYATAEYLEKLFAGAIEHPDIVALSIATRPDCLPEDIIDLLGRLNKIKPVWVELGLQTVNERIAEYIRRGYETRVYDDAVRRLKSEVSHIVTHVILGLPGEAGDDMLRTVRHAASAGTDGIKLQLLHVLKGTDLAEEYEKSRFDVMNLPQYCEIVGRCLEALPPDIVVHRITGDGDKRLLIAPMWSADKKNVLNTLRRYMEENDIVQGRAYSSMSHTEI